MTLDCLGAIPLAMTVSPDDLLAAPALDGFIAMLLAMTSASPA
jgi:uncharacterized membrane protein YqgA involved in biofilm formation